jgi:enoyl-CoA hydratase/carnithine racemase
MAEAEADRAQDADGPDKARLVQYSAGEGIALLTLNDPPANNYTYEMMQELDRSILAARMDEDVHVIVITGGGEKFFSAGANIGMLAEMTPQFKYFFCLHANETLSRLEQTPKLVIAALNGHTVGGGLEIALAADIRIARRGAGKMGLPEITLGVLPGTGGTQRLVRVVGKSRAIELMTTGELFAFEHGQELGLINHIYEAESGAQFIEQVMDYARQFTLPGKATRAVGRIKRSVQSGAEIPFEYALALERELQQQLFQSEDAREGLDAYVEKRKPQFKGK